MSSIIGNFAGCYSPMGKTFILQDENGNELTGVVVAQETVFDAKPSDVRINKTFAGDEGVKVGENTITYRTAEGSECIFPGEDFRITCLDEYNKYDYTKLQCIIVKYSSNVNDRMSAEKIVINDGIYNVGSSIVVSTVTKDAVNKIVNFNFSNDTSDAYIIYFLTYSEEES